MKLQPIIIALLTIIVGGVLIYQHEQHLSQGRTVYAKLAPADPRSLMQGDYMRLGYELSGVNDGEMTSDTTRWRQAWAQIDGDGRIVSVDWQASAKHDTPLMLKHNRWQWHPATDSFMFAEGLGECYAKASYAKLSVRDGGRAMLVDLVDDTLAPLGCTAQTSWWRGVSHADGGE